MPDNAVPQLMTPLEVARALKVSVVTVRRLSAAGRLSKVYIGGSVRYRAEDVRALIETRWD